MEYEDIIKLFLICYCRYNTCHHKTLFISSPLQIKASVRNAREIEELQTKVQDQAINMLFILRKHNLYSLSLRRYRTSPRGKLHLIFFRLQHPACNRVGSRMDCKRFQLCAIFSLRPFLSFKPLLAVAPRERLIFAIKSRSEHFRCVKNVVIIFSTIVYFKNGHGKIHFLSPGCQNCR